MGKAKKEHRKKIQKRNEKIKQDQSRMEKLKRAFFQQIMKERESGAFNWSRWSKYFRRTSNLKRISYISLQKKMC